MNDGNMDWEDGVLRIFRLWRIGTHAANTLAIIIVIA